MQRLHLRQLELQALDLPGEQADLLLEVLDAHQQLRRVLALRHKDAAIGDMAAHRRPGQSGSGGKASSDMAAVKDRASAGRPDFCSRSRDSFTDQCSSFIRLDRTVPGQTRTPAVRHPGLAHDFDKKKAPGPDYASTRRLCLQSATGCADRAIVRPSQHGGFVTSTRYRCRSPPGVPCRTTSEVMRPGVDATATRDS